MIYPRHLHTTPLGAIIGNLEGCYRPVRARLPVTGLKQSGVQFATRDNYDCHSAGPMENLLITYARYAVMYSLENM